VFTAAAVPLWVLYPLFKRFTHWPQAWLAVFMNWFVPAAWLAETGGITAPALVLYLGGALWTLGYDTVYAIQDRADDERAGVKSTAVLFGDHARHWIAVFYALALVAIAAAGLLAGLPVWYLALLAPAAGHLAWQVARVADDRPEVCGAVFARNWQFGSLVLAALVAR